MRAPNQEHALARHTFMLGIPAAESDPRTHALSAFIALLVRYGGEPNFRMGISLAPDLGATEIVVELELEASVSYLRSCLEEALTRSERTSIQAYPRLSVNFAELSSRYVAADLSLVVEPAPEGFSACFEYDQEVFELATVERLARGLQCLSAAMAEHPELTVGQLPLLSELELSHQLAAWTGAHWLRSTKPIHHCVLEQAKRRPEAKAVSFRDRSLSYGELMYHASALAQQLAREGVGIGARVAVCLEPGLDTVVCLLGVLMAGATYVPLDPSYPIERLRLMVDDTAAQVLLTQRSLLSVVPSVARIWCVDDREHLLTFAPGAAPALPVEVDLSQVAYVIYTSGTTGTPKGVMVSHQNLAHYVLSAQRKYRFNEGDVMPAMARSTFSITMLEMFSTLAVGGRLIVLEREHVLDFRRLVPTLRETTVLHASPSLLRKLVAFVREQGLDVTLFDGLRHVSSGGDLVSGDLLESLKRVFRQAELFVIYGCSEISCMGCTFEVPRESVVSKSMVGSAFENMSVRLYDARQQLVPFGVVGEIYFGGEGVSLGYLGREDLTREKFVEVDGQRFYRTGDLGRSDEHGQLENPRSQRFSTQASRHPHRAR
ncbi:MAG: AMP-binding protein [Myxococcales bacterium]